MCFCFFLCYITQELGKAWYRTLGFGKRIFGYVWNLQNLMGKILIKKNCNDYFHCTGRVLCLTFLFKSNRGSKSNEPRERNRRATTCYLQVSQRACSRRHAPCTLWREHYDFRRALRVPQNCSCRHRMTFLEEVTLPSLKWYITMIYICD